jgi:hypothetical protein
MDGCTQNMGMEQWITGYDIVFLSCITFIVLSLAAINFLYINVVASSHFIQVCPKY